MMGNVLRERDQQYIANRDEKTQTWRILDTWHDDLRNLTPEDDVPDESSALTILTEGGFIALIREAARLGVLQNATTGGDGLGLGEEEGNEGDILDLEDSVKEKEETITKQDAELRVLRTEINSLKENTIELAQQASHTEEYELKGMAMNHILKLVSMSDVANLSRD